MDGGGWQDKSASCPAQRNKTVLVLDGQAEVNGAAKLFVVRAGRRMAIIMV